MYPEAGGSSSFARRAFNEFWSFFAAWAQMLTYVVDDRDLRVLRPALPRRAVLGGAAPLARRHHRRRVRDRRAGGHQRRRRQGVDGAQRDAGGHRLPDPGAAGAGRRRARASRRRRWSTTSTSASRRRGTNFILAIPIGMLAYTGIETISNMAEEAKDETKTIPIGDQPRADRRVRDLLHAAGRRAVGAAGHAERQRRVPDAARPDRGAGRLRRRPDPRRRQADRPRAAPERRRRSTSACSPRRSSSSPPTRA